MTLEGFYRWTRDEDSGGAAGGEACPEPREPSGASDHPPESQSAVRRASPEDLEIERKQFLLAGVDPERFGYFFDTYYDRIHEYAYWRSGDQDVAADVVAETFLKAWDKRRQFRFQRYTFGAWLFQIARRVLSHNERWLRRHPETEFLPGVHDPLVDVDGEKEFERRNDRQVIRRCLQQLSPDRYEIVVLHHFVGMDTRQISIVTGRPHGTVCSHLRRGKKVLRRWLEEHGEEEGLSDRALRIVRRTAAEEAGFEIVDDEDDT